MKSALGLFLIALCGAQLAEGASPRAFEMLKTAMALTPNPGHGEVLYIKHCVSCHRGRGEGNGPKDVPALAGQREYYLLEQLVFFASLDRNAPAMHSVVQRPDLGSSTQSLRDLAAYLSHAPGNPAADHGDGRALATGERVYNQSCAVCHGKNGEGSDNEPIPAIGGQHYRYIVDQLDAFTVGHRSFVEPPVIEIAAGLSPDERQSVADYISRLTALRLPAATK